MMTSRLRRHAAPLAFLLLTWGTYFAVLFAKIISWRPDGIYLGSVNTWSDWALHIALANRFAYLSPHYWFASHPLFAGAPMNYPFMADLIPGMLMRAGLPLYPAMVIPSIITALAFLVLAYAVLARLLRGRWQAVAAISIFLLSAGFGFLHFLSDLQANPSLNALLAPAIEYSRNDSYGWYGGNVVTALLLPQRAILLGMAVALGSLYLLLAALQAPRLADHGRKLLAAGLLAGALPVIHPHSLIALAVFSAFLCAPRWREWRPLLWYALPAAIISLALYKIFISTGFHVNTFMKWDPGMGLHDLGTWLREWLYWRWGAMLPVAAASLWLLRRTMTAELRRIAWGAVAIFAAANLVSFQPTEWDNSKLFTWCYFVFAALAAALLASMWRTRGLRLLAIYVASLLTFTGALELTRLQRTDLNSYQETSAADIALGEQIRRETDPSAVFLTAPAHNDFVMIWGCRSVFLGFTSWVENYGFASTPRYWDSRTIYAGGSAAAEAIARNKISYVIVSAGEMSSYSVNEPYFSAAYPLAFTDGATRVYDVRSAW